MGTKIAHAAIDENITCKEAARRSGLLPEEAVEELFDVKNLVDPDRMEELFKKYQNFRKV